MTDADVYTVGWQERYNDNDSNRTSYNLITGVDGRTANLGKVEVFEDADVVVIEGQGVAGLRQEGVTPSGVLEVVDQGAEDEGHGLDVLQVLPQLAHLYDGSVLAKGRGIRREKTKRLSAAQKVIPGTR